VPAQYATDDLVPLWRKAVFAVIAVAVGIRAAWLDGIGNLQWTLPLIMAGLLFMPRPAGALGKGLNWPLRLVYFFWTALLAVWAKQMMGWIPALMIPVIWLVGPQERDQQASWENFLGKPLAVISNLTLVAFFAWLLAKDRSWLLKDGDWLPSVCVVGPLLLLMIESRGRRTLKRNIFRVHTLLWFGVALAAVLWIYLQPSLGKALVLVVILTLWFGNLLYHLSPGERLALPHPQS